MIVHYHVEKTAGSSFRDLCVSHFGEPRCECLYGPNSKSTTIRMREIAYPDGEPGNPRNIGEVVAYLMERKPAFFSTHATGLVRPHFPRSVQTIAFFREPVARLVSHYNHWSLQGHFKGSFEEFYRTEEFRNWQSKRFSIAEMEELHFVGVTERFDAAIDMLNRRLGINLARLHTNRTPWRPFQVNAARLPAAVEAEIRSLNAADFELYDAVVQRFAADLAALRTI